MKKNEARYRIVPRMVVLIKNLSKIYYSPIFLIVKRFVIHFISETKKDDSKSRLILNAVF